MATVLIIECQQVTNEPLEKNEGTCAVQQPSTIYYVRFNV